jgi:hypothetical protein
MILQPAVPPSQEEYRTLFGSRKQKATGHEVEHHDHDMHDDVYEDAPFVVFLRIVLQQVIGWYWYLLSHITAGPNSGAYLHNSSLTSSLDI